MFKKWWCNNTDTFGPGNQFYSASPPAGSLCNSVTENQFGMRYGTGNLVGTTDDNVGYIAARSITAFVRTAAEIVR